MTRQRNDEHSTEFGIWLRKQEEIDSELGFIATNIDYVWSNYKTNQWMILEEKRHMSDTPYAQHEQFNQLHRACKDDPNYHGLHLIQFEITSPDDGGIFLDRKAITKDQLMEFLKTFTVPVDSHERKVV